MAKIQTDTVFNDFLIRIPIEREEFFLRLMHELGFEILLHDLPVQQPFSLPQSQDITDNQTLQEAVTEAEEDITNGHYLFSDEVRDLVKTWKKNL